MPKVDLPEPDSPTMPRVSPRTSEISTLSTATKSRCLNQPCFIVKLQRICSACNKAGASDAGSATNLCGCEPKSFCV